MTTLARTADWLFRDRTTGAVVIAQVPNVALLVWLAATVVGLVASGTAHDVVGWIGTGALCFWAAQELVDGVNPFRHLLGAAVLGATVVGLVRLVV